MRIVEGGDWNFVDFVRAPIKQNKVFQAPTVSQKIVFKLKCHSNLFYTIFALINPYFFLTDVCIALETLIILSLILKIWMFIVKRNCLYIITNDKNVEHQGSKYRKSFDF